jgi:hypothetical protein
MSPIADGNVAHSAFADFVARSNSVAFGARRTPVRHSARFMSRKSLNQIVWSMFKAVKAESVHSVDHRLSSMLCGVTHL